MCFNHVNTCKFWATRILVGMKKKRLCTDTSAQLCLLYLNPWSSYCLCHTAQQLFVFTLSSVLLIIHNLISPKEWKHSNWILLFIDKLFFCQQSFFLEVLAAHSSTYVGEIRDSVDLVPSPGPMTDGWQVYQWELKLAAPGSLSLRGKNSTDLPHAMQCHIH